MRNISLSILSHQQAAISKQGILVIKYTVVWVTASCLPPFSQHTEQSSLLSHKNTEMADKGLCCSTVRDPSNLSWNLEAVPTIQPTRCARHCKNLPIPGLKTKNCLQLALQCRACHDWRAIGAELPGSSAQPMAQQEWCPPTSDKGTGLNQSCAAHGLTCNIPQGPHSLLTDVSVGRGQQGNEGWNCPSIHHCPGLLWSARGNVGECPGRFKLDGTAVCSAQEWDKLGDQTSPNYVVYWGLLLSWEEFPKEEGKQEALFLLADIWTTK